MPKPKIFKTALANVIREACEGLYSSIGASKVYEYANKLKLVYHECKPCDAETPTISDVNNHTCAICGTEKEPLIE